MMTLSSSFFSFLLFLSFLMIHERNCCCYYSCRGEKKLCDGIHALLSQETHFFSTSNSININHRVNMAEQVPSSVYRSVLFGLNQLTDQNIGELLRSLTRLPAMNKHGPMSGRCGPQTDQMEHFLSDAFLFKNIPGQYIAQGIHSFELERPACTMDPSTIIHFPSNKDKSFDMTVEEILNWQRSFKVYADGNIDGMDKEFLRRALKGGSAEGEEAFRMKFVVRISACPILMAFDAEILPRTLNDDWPNRIKLISACGIDFAGRNHDVWDILYYIANWRAIFTIDPHSNLPFAHGGRDFCPKNDRPQTKLRKQRVLDSLIRMARLRLQACDIERVQIVVETGIGLGVFSGGHIGIDRIVRALSAEAIRRVLEEDGGTFKSIQAIVFALPILHKSKSKDGDVFDVFEREFRRSKYNGPIPVLIADQDMHQLTIAAARQGFIVSELNPGDSHGVFGEYWQNRGPAVEEKLALTTLGLLVQHHLINPEVINTDNYYLLSLDKAVPLNYSRMIHDADNATMTCKSCSIL